MLQVVMFDLGGTLVTGSPPALLPGVIPAIQAIQALPTGNSSSLQLCLVSNFTMPPTPATPVQVATLFDQYVALLANLGLKPLFEPVRRHVTLSTHCGVDKPDCRVFDMALLRLGLDVPFASCLFITEEAAHIAAAQQIGMKTIRFGAPGAAGVQLDNWSNGPQLVQGLLH